MALLPPPLKYRRAIPFYYDKSVAEFRRDPYENFAELVTRQAQLHFSFQPYPWQPVQDFMLNELPASPQNIVDVGCGVGRLIGEIAEQLPTANCYGLDYSYQLLKVASDYFVTGKRVEINNAARGFPIFPLVGNRLENVKFVLAQAEQLPFADDSLAVVCSSFALDRFEQPLVALTEIYRCLKTEGRAIICSPLNFQQSAHWSTCYPPERLLAQLLHIGFKIRKTEVFTVVEPLDRRGNAVHWQVLGMVLVK